jgi:putative nucleotidyltransferase with HDIG domain
MGGFSIEMTHPRRWSEQEMQFVDAIGRQVGTVAERLRLIDETRAHAAHMEALHGAGAALRQADSLDALYDVIVEQAIALGRADQASLMLLEADATHFKCIRAHGGATTAQGARFPVAGSIQGMAIQRAEPFVTPDASADHLSSCNGAMEVIGPCVAVPLREGDETIGALLIARRHGTLPGPFVPREVGVLTALAEMASSAIHRAQLYDQMLRRSAQLQALREIDQAITGSLDLHLSLDVVLTKAMTQLQVDAACVLLFNPHLQTLEYAAAQGFRTVVLHHLRINLGEGCAGRAALERRRVGLEDLDMAAYPLALTRVAQGRSEGIKATFATPLIAKGQLLGVLQVFFRRATSPSHDWLAFFDTLAGQSAIAISDARQFQALQRSNDDLVRAYDTTLAGWARALELRDKETRGHTQRVTEMAVRLATQLGVPETQLTHIRRGALLHDIGKMAVSDMVLLKPGPLTSEERVIMERHPVYAYNLLEPIDYLRLSIDIPYCHHEKWDGTGYPRGLKGTDIPLAARIFAVVDVWDALTSERPYRGAWTAERAEKHIKEHAGTHFDPTVVKAFISMLAEERARTPEGNPTPER